MTNLYSANGYIGYPTNVDNYHMNWADIKAMMPQKAEILKEYWNLSNQHPHRTSTPVFDVTTKEIYQGYNLGLPIDGPYLITTINMATKRAIDSKRPWKCKYKLAVTGHKFLACEEVPIEILKDALEIKRAEVKERKEKEDRALEEKIAKYIKITKELDAIIAECKELIAN